jgi:tRNA pseudouridine synthase 10
VPNCDCTDFGGDSFQNPLCQAPGGAFDTTQRYAKAYPSLRQLQVLNDYGANSIVASICKAFGTRKNKFHGAGREDVDVRMLGRGRPFVLEMVEPKQFDVDLAALEAEINRRNAGRLEVEGLHWTEKARVAYLKETPHAKEYEALVAFEAPVAEAAFLPHLEQRLDVVQKTPERVAHRRADKDRERWIELLAAEPASEPGGDGLRWRVRLRTQHGTYVKEALSGEGGATEPSLASLVGVPCRCIELDVLAILAEDGADEPAPRSSPPRFGAGLA